MMSVNPVSPQYTICRLPTSSLFISKFRETKLAALEKDPTEWFYPHAFEVNHPLSVWESRLAPPTSVWVCVSNNDTSLSAEEALIQGEWVGFAAVRGPIPFDTYYASPDMLQPIPEDPDAETRWHTHDLYVFPAHRGNGIARKLMAACVATPKVATNTNDKDGVKRARLRLFTDTRKAGLVDTYKRWGFKESGKISRRDGLQANGMSESVPHDTKSTEELRQFFETRVGIAMEKVVELT
jgi:GNAT superfamily N-acetyltransferase